MAAVVGDSEGPKTKFEVVKVAPKNDEQPTLQVGDGNNNTIEVKILAPNANMECEVSWRRQILTIFSYKTLIRRWNLIKSDTRLWEKMPMRNLPVQS